MKVLLIGSGGREHALGWKIATSPLLEKLYFSPGNPGTAELGENNVLNLEDHGQVIDFCCQKHIDLVIIGPETPLVDGLSDSLRQASITVLGPSKAAAQLEGSKAFTKDLCARFNIPTAACRCFDDENQATEYVRGQNLPIVIKADGLTAGKGVVVAMTQNEALAAIHACFDGEFGLAGARIVIEEFLTGVEASFFCLCDGKKAIPFGTAQDHKRLEDGDKGPNTGGMGAFSPALAMDDAMVKRVMDDIITPTMQGMAEMGCPFSGILFAGLMMTVQGPKLIEYNVRFGDPECQTLMLRLQDDLLPLLLQAAQGQLQDKTVKWSDETALLVVLAAKGYPHAPRKGGIIRGLDKASLQPGVQIFHAGTARTQEQLLASGGRVLNVVAKGCDIAMARARVYDAIDEIDWTDCFYRRDIGLAVTHNMAQRP